MYFNKSFFKIILKFHFFILLLQSETKKRNKMSMKGTITTSDYLPYEEYKRLVESLAAEKEYFWCAYCIVSFCTGLRFSDISKLRWGDIVGQRNLIVTEKKTSKTKRIPIGENARAHIESLYKKLGSPSKAAFVIAGKNGQPVSIQYVNKTLKKWRDRYALDVENFSTHTFRKTFGRYVYEKSGRSNQALLYLNRIFRHANLDTTMIYLGIRDEEIGSIFESITI